MGTWAPTVMKGHCLAPQGTGTKGKRKRRDEQALGQAVKQDSRKAVIRATIATTAKCSEGRGETAHWLRRPEHPRPALEGAELPQAGTADLSMCSGPGVGVESVLLEYWLNALRG